VFSLLKKPLVLENSGPFVFPQVRLDGPNQSGVFLPPGLPLHCSTSSYNICWDGAAAVCRASPLDPAAAVVAQAFSRVPPGLVLVYCRISFGRVYLGRMCQSSDRHCEPEGQRLPAPKNHPAAS